jgi:ATP-binding protein involved in chromosome partitioning
MTPLPTADAVTAALATVLDPEIHRPITDLGMVKSVDVRRDGSVDVAVFLTVAGCPMRDRINADVTAAVSKVPGVTGVRIELDVMSEEQRRALQAQLRGGQPVKEVPFGKRGSLTRVYGIASGKGGVGKSSVTVNLAVAMAESGLSVGVVDADIYGHSIPRMLRVTEQPTKISEEMFLPPTAYGVKVLSIGMFSAGRPVTWRGPMLHRALQQFLTDFWWGDLDVLLLDLPPGTGDVAISLGQLIPSSELVVVTTPQAAAREVAERAGVVGIQLRQTVTGVIENMAGLPCPHCGEMIDVFGSGGGAAVAEALSTATGTSVPLLGSVPIDVRLREGGDVGHPLVLADPDAPAAKELRGIAERLGSRARGLVGRPLGLTPVGR